jgi:hypothetical protein
MVERGRYCRKWSFGKPHGWGPDTPCAKCAWVELRKKEIRDLMRPLHRRARRTEQINRRRPGARLSCYDHLGYVAYMISRDNDGIVGCQRIFYTREGANCQAFYDPPMPCTKSKAAIFVVWQYTVKRDIPEIPAPKSPYPGEVAPRYTLGRVERPSSG